MKNIGILFVDYFFKNSGSLLGIGLGGRGKRTLTHAVIKFLYRKRMLPRISSIVNRICKRKHADLMLFYIGSRKIGCGIGCNDKIIHKTS